MQLTLFVFTRFSCEHVELILGCGQTLCQLHRYVHVCLQERLEREYNLDLVTTAPTVVYKCMQSDGVELTVNSPGDLPEATKRDSISEPYVRYYSYYYYHYCYQYH